MSDELHKESKAERFCKIYLNCCCYVVFVTGSVGVLYPILLTGGGWFGYCSSFLVLLILPPITWVWLHAIIKQISSFRREK